jgi:rubrerythrin
MFTRTDYLEYFQQIAAIEKEMMLHLENILKVTEDIGIKAQLKEVAEDESRHYAYVKEVIDEIT